MTTGKIATNRMGQRGIHDNSVRRGDAGVLRDCGKVEPIPDEAMALLGHPGRSTYYNWKSGNVSACSAPAWI